MSFTREDANTRENPKYGEPDENGFVGVDLDHANYANETDKPAQADGDKLEELEAAGVNNQWEVADGTAEVLADSDDKSDDSKSKSAAVKPPSPKNAGSSS